LCLWNLKPLCFWNLKSFHYMRRNHFVLPKKNRVVIILKTARYSKLYYPLNKNEIIVMFTAQFYFNLLERKKT
jgi:hypothetical protein